MLSVNQSLELLIDLILKIENCPKYFVVLKKSLQLIVKQLSVYKNKYLGNAIDVAADEGYDSLKTTNEYKIRRRLTSIKLQFQTLADYKNNPTIFKQVCKVIRKNAIEAKTLLDDLFDVFPIPEMPVKRWREPYSHFMSRKIHYEQTLDKLKREKKI